MFAKTLRARLRFGVKRVLSAIAGLVAGAATLLTQDVDDKSVVFLLVFAMWGGVFGVAAGFLSNLLVVDRVYLLQVFLVFGVVTALLAMILWNPNGRPVALQLIGLSLAQPVLCISVGLALRRIASS